MSRFLLMPRSLTAGNKSNEKSLISTGHPYKSTYVAFFHHRVYIGTFWTSMSNIFRNVKWNVLLDH